VSERLSSERVPKGVIPATSAGTHTADKNLCEGGGGRNADIGIGLAGTPMLLDLGGCPFKNFSQWRNKFPIRGFHYDIGVRLSGGVTGPIPARGAKLNPQVNSSYS